MTKQARLVLDDCRGALSELIDGLQGTVWRRRWITCVILLRAVGHVLKNVDANACGALKSEISAAFEQIKQTKPCPIIFWEFIEKERNHIVKQYKFNAGQGIRITGGEAGYNESGKLVYSSQGSIEFLYKINSGPFEGRNQVDVIQEAIDWWENYLDEIDKAVTNATIK